MESTEGDMCRVDGYYSFPELDVSDAVSINLESDLLAAVMAAGRGALVDAMEDGGNSVVDKSQTVPDA